VVCAYGFGGAVGVGFAVGVGLALALADGLGGATISGLVATTAVCGATAAAPPMPATIAAATPPGAPTIVPASAAIVMAG
jgi:hypothetical protein